MEPASSEAYDLSIFDNKPAEEVDRDIKIRTLRVIKSRRRVRAVAPYKIILAVIAALAVTTLMIYSRVMLMELNAEIGNYQERITVMESEYVRLSAELESSTAMKTLEKSAVDDLGLTKIDSSQIEYMNLAAEDKIEVAKVRGSFVIAQWWDSFISWIGEYISF